MRKLTIIVTVAAIVAAGFPTSPVLAQAPASCLSTVQTFSNPLQTLIKGQLLTTNQIKNEISSNPNLANNFTACLQDPLVTPGQQAAIKEALAELYQAGILTAGTPGLSPAAIAIIALLAAAAGVGIYEGTKTSCNHGSVGPSC
jgi:hypothetical protein